MDQTASTRDRNPVKGPGVAGIKNPEQIGISADLLAYYTLSASEFVKNT